MKKIFLLLILLLFNSLNCNFEYETDKIKQQMEEEQKQNSVYTVKCGNLIGHKNFYCDYYFKTNNAYQLFNKDSVLIIEIAITDGYYVLITRN